MTADLDALRDLLGTVSNVNNTHLQRCLDTAITEIRREVYAERFDDEGTQLAILFTAQRLYKHTPEGVSGWNDLGAVRIVMADPDIAKLLERKRDMHKAGVA